MATAESCVTADFALGYREMMLQGLANEVQTTKKVLSAILEGKKDFRFASIRSRFERSI